MTPQIVTSIAKLLSLSFAQAKQWEKWVHVWHWQAVATCSTIQTRKMSSSSQNAEFVEALVELAC